jgi:hypothetical protein
MIWIRGVVAVVLAYVAAVIPNMFWVTRFHVPERAPMSWLLLAGTVVVLLASGLVAGLVCRAVAGDGARVAVPVAAVVLLAVGALNLSLAMGVEPRWHTMVATAAQPLGLLWAGLQRRSKRFV